MLALDRLAKTYADGTRALEGVSLRVAAGETLALVGGSGCGKTTLVRLVAGLDTPSSGAVSLDGDALRARPDPRVGVVFQEPRLLPWLTVGDNVGFGLASLPKAERQARVAAALEAIGLPGHGPRWPRELSGGQAQRVALARALVLRPRALLLDEPFSALDATTRAGLHDRLLALRSAGGPRRGPATLIVTHDVEEAVVLADRIVVMCPNPGRVFDELNIGLAHPRDRRGPGVEALKRRVLDALDRSLDRPGTRDLEASASAAALWW